MLDFLLNLLGNTSGVLAYLMVFAILVACGLGVPLPEDISLLLGGYLAHKGAAHLPIMMVVGFAGILVGDSLIFFAGRRIGGNVGKKGGFFARIVTPEKRAKVEGLFGRHGSKIVMIARFMPGVRAVTYFTAGSSGMSFWRFIFWDGLAALASAPVFVWLGAKYGDKLDWLIEQVHQGQYYVFGALGVLGLGIFVWRRRKAALAKQAEAQLAMQAVPVLASDEKIIVPQLGTPAPAAMFEMADASKSSGRTGAQE